MRHDWGLVMAVVVLSCVSRELFAVYDRTVNQESSRRPGAGSRLRVVLKWFSVDERTESHTRGDQEPFQPLLAIWRISCPFSYCSGAFQ